MPLDNTNQDVALMDEVDVLLKMKHLLRVPQLWSRMNLYQHNRACILGALYWVDHGMRDSAHLELRHAASEKVLRKLHEVIVDDFGLEDVYDSETTITTFNDRPQTKHAHVIKLLDKTISTFETERG